MAVRPMIGLWGGWARCFWSRGIGLSELSECVASGRQIPPPPLRSASECQDLTRNDKNLRVGARMRLWVRELIYG